VMMYSTTIVYHSFLRFLFCHSLTLSSPSLSFFFLSTLLLSTFDPSSSPSSYSFYSSQNSSLSVTPKVIKLSVQSAKGVQPH
jgi:hypothetical protein